VNGHGRRRYCGQTEGRLRRHHVGRLPLSSARRLWLAALRVLTVATVRSLASGVEALVVTNQSSKNVRLAGRFTDLPVVNVRAEVDLCTDEYSTTVERQERETDGSIGGWGSSERRKALVRATAHNAVRDGRDAASPPTIRQLDRRQARTRRFDTDKEST
jgi:hypothetical protein